MIDEFKNIQKEAEIGDLDPEQIEPDYLKMKKGFVLSEKMEEIKKYCMKNFKSFKRGNFVELFEAIEKQNKEFTKRLEKAFENIEEYSDASYIVDKLAGDKLNGNI